MTHGTDEPHEPADPSGPGDVEPRPGAHAAPAVGDTEDSVDSGELPAGSFRWSYDAPEPTETPQPDSYQPDSYQPDSYQPDTSAPEAYPADTYQADPYRFAADQYPAAPDPAEQRYPVPPAAQQQSYEQPSYEQTAYEQPAYEQPAYEQHQYEQQQYPGYPQPAYEPPPAPPAPTSAPTSAPMPPQPGYAPQPFAPQPPPAPRPEDLLVPNQTPITDEPASWGWRGRVNRASGGMFKPKASPAELAVRKSITDIQHSFSRPMTVVVVQPKGGAGKTPTTICLSAALGAYRGGYVVGWDDNETRGTLAVRVTNPDNQQTTVWDLLSDLAAFERYDARVGDLSRYVRAQPDAHFDALVSDDNPGNMAQIGEREYQRLHTVLQRFYRMIVVDTGNNVRSPNWQAAVNSADQIVVVSTYQRDVGYSASWVLDHLAQTDRADLARNAVTILSAADPTTDTAVRDQLVPHFQARTRAVCEVPYDTELAHGGPIRWAHLAPATRNAWIHAGATIVNCLADDDRRALAERRS
ncbi:hypothetical protein [Jatrophihabitans endophyticus]|uniref:hypothetical protein n=1 Tax=Jatrophihabitans endophyticus TaxID=1206085 RepID=UPI0019EA28E8|nr:hypothetical protein [Jatrophihabitans endophyticus]MBE7186725.1 hypothetical protein [Jatrophihabitans endophyticus]